jgi:hypothetical protein
MRDSTRLFATLVIWIAFAAMVSTLMTSVTGAIAKAGGAELFGIILVLAATALISTLAIWVGGDRSSGGTSASAASRSKTKRVGRGDRIERLVDQLDDEDIYELEAMLLARDRNTDKSQPPR